MALTTESKNRFLIPICAVTLSVALREGEHLPWTTTVAARVLVCLGMVLTTRI